MEAPAQDSLGIRQDRPILGAGRGRIVVLAVAVGAILPVLVLRRLGDAAIADWIASHAAATPDADAESAADSILGFGRSARVND